MNIMHVCIVALHEGLHWYGQGGGGVSRDFGQPIQGSALSRLASKMTVYNIVVSEVCTFVLDYDIAKHACWCLLSTITNCLLIMSF